MDAFAVSHFHRLQKALRQGRVRMNGMKVMTDASVEKVDTTGGKCKVYIKP